MSATLLTATKLTREGVLVTAQSSDETNGNSLLLTGFETIEINNTDSGSHSVTFVAQSADSRGNKVNLTKAVANAVTHVFGPFPISDWADANGLLQMTWSSTSSTTMKLRICQNLINNPQSTLE